MILFGRIEGTWRHKNTKGEMVLSPLEAVSLKNWRDIVFLPDKYGRSPIVKGGMAVRPVPVPSKEAKAFLEAARGKDLAAGHVGGLAAAPVLLAGEVEALAVAVYGSRRKDTDVEILWDALEGLAYPNDRCIGVKHVQRIIDKERPRLLFALWDAGSTLLTATILLAIEAGFMREPGLSGIHSAESLARLMEGVPS